MRMTIDFGIDLGTTNSSIAVKQGNDVRVIKNNENMEYTPSAIWIDKQGTIRVGASAKARAGRYDTEAFVKFKREMGSNKTYTFSTTNQIMRPYDLSAEVLKSLKGNAQQRLGENITAVVITVPADFKAPQTEATKHAAQLAGITTCPIIMEPTAAAMAYAFNSKVDNVFWLVYDLGGGTFDAAVIKIQDGNFIIVNHAGDTEVGGSDIDKEIVDQLLVPYIVNTYGLRDMSRSHPDFDHTWRSTFAQLTEEVEKAKISCSQSESWEITIDRLVNPEKRDIPVEFTLKRSDVERLAAPMIRKSINLCKKALQDAQLPPSAIEQVILVGGPTLAPYLREQLLDPTDGLGIPLNFTIDPLTVVAQGAAYFAGTQRLEGEGDSHPSEGKFIINLKYQPVVQPGMSDVPISGIVKSNDVHDFSSYTIEFANRDSKPKWTSGKNKLSQAGKFMVSLLVQPEIVNNFDITITDLSGKIILTEPKEFPIQTGITPGGVHLINAIGVALAGNQSDWFCEKGTPLPTRKRKTLKSAIALQHGRVDDVLLVPIIEGNKRLADRNLLIGTLKISGDQISRNLPEDSEVEVTIDIDTNRLIKTEVYIPILEQEFASAVSIEYPDLDIELLSDGFENEKERFGQIRERAQRSGDMATLNILETRIEAEDLANDISRSLAAARGDTDAARVAQHRFLDLRVALDEAEDNVRWPSLVAEAENQLGETREIVSKFKQEEIPAVNKLEREMRQAVENHNIEQLERVKASLFELQAGILNEQPGFWLGFFEYLRDEQQDIMTNKETARRLVTKGEQAIQNNDLSTMKAVVHQMLNLLPKEKRQAIMDGYGGGLH